MLWSHHTPKVDKTPCQEGLTGGVGTSGRAADPTCPPGLDALVGALTPELHWDWTEHTQRWEEEGEPWESGLVWQA